MEFDRTDAAASASTYELALTAEQQAQYYALEQQPDQAASFLSQALRLPEAQHDARQAIVLDYASYVLGLAAQLKLSPAQTGVLLDTAGAALAAIAAGATRKDVQDLMKERLMTQCNAHPGPGSAGLTADQIGQAARFFAATLLQHHSLYVHALGREQAHAEHVARLHVETPLVPPTLSAALPEDEWRAAREAEAAAKLAAIEAAAAAERDRAQQAAEAAEAQAQAAAVAARQEQLSKRPTSLSEAVEQLVAVRLEEERAALHAHYQQREAELVGRLESVRGALAAPVPAGAGRK